jgi:hypothetical protein
MRHHHLIRLAAESIGIATLLFFCALAIAVYLIGREQRRLYREERQLNRRALKAESRTGSKPAAVKRAA